MTTEEWPHTAGWLGEIPEASRPFESVRRRALLHAAKDANARAMAASVTELAEVTDRLEAMLETKERT